MIFRTRRGARAAVSIASALLLLSALTGCSLFEDSEPAVSGAPGPVPTGVGSEAPGEGLPGEGVPELVPDGDAAANLALFEHVVNAVWATEARAQGLAYIDALTAAGFDRTDMQVTEDTTTVGNPAESIQFSVRWGDDECLVGQVGPSTGDPVVAVMEQLAEGRCLIGKTRDIEG